jgi:4-hydroxy-4-methyl-2-oxoglutarate aldolase
MYNEPKQPLTSFELDALRQLDACTLANSIEMFHERLRNEGFMDGSVRCLFPQLPVMLGFAATIKLRAASLPTAGNIYADRTDWWEFINSLPKPRTVVIEDASNRPGLGSLVGAVHMNILKALHCVGVVTNGSVRDIPAAEAAGFHYFSGNIAVSHSYVHIIEYGKPVCVGGLKIQPGDLLHGDLHGVQSIPLDLATRIPAVAAKITAREKTIIDVCQSTQFSLEKLRAAVRGE